MKSSIKHMVVAAAVALGTVSTVNATDIAPVGGLNDSFQMDGQNYDIETLMMTLQAERADNINNQLMDQANLIKQKNALLKEANTILAAARKARAGGASADEIADIDAFMEVFGIENDGNIQNDNTAEWDQNIENIKGYIDTINSTSQLDMIRLQSLMNKYNQAFDMMTNMLSKFGKSKDSIIGNIR